MANSKDQTRTIVLWAVAAIIVLGLIGWWAGWFSGSAPTPTAETPAPATTTEQPATTTTEPPPATTTEPPPATTTEPPPATTTP